MLAKIKTLPVSLPVTLAVRLQTLTKASTNPSKASQTVPDQRIRSLSECGKLSEIIKIESFEGSAAMSEAALFLAA